MKAVQWCPDGNPLSGVPGEVVRLLATDGVTRGYGYGEGWSMMFGSPQGDVRVEPGQWVVVHDDGRITVEDDVAGMPSPDGGRTAAGPTCGGLTA